MVNIKINININIILIIVLVLAISAVSGDELDNTGDKTVTDTEPLEVAPAKENDKEYADNAVFFTESNMYKFANYMFNLGEYDRALVEYHRFNFTYPESELEHLATFKVGLSYEKLGEYKRARRQYLKLVRHNRDKEVQQICRYRVAATFYSSAQWDSTLSFITNLEVGRETDIADAFEYLKGWCYLQKSDYGSAIEVFQRLKDSGNSQDALPSLHFLISKSRQGLILPHKNPAVSGVLSTVIPGAGQAYCERWGDAAFSAFFTLGALGSAIYFWEDDETFAITTGVIGVFFYLGNVYGAITSAKLFNKHTTEDFMQKTQLGVPHKPTRLFQEIR